jgi:hypothetical protein
LSRGSRGPRRSGGGVQSHGNARKIRVARGMGGEHTWCGLHPQHEQELLEHEVELVHARAHLTCRRATHAFMQVRIRSGSRRKRYEAQGAWLASEYMSCPSAACARAHRTPRGGRARRQERRVAGYHFLFYSCGSHLKINNDLHTLSMPVSNCSERGDGKHDGRERRNTRDGIAHDHRILDGEHVDHSRSRGLLPRFSVCGRRGRCKVGVRVAVRCVPAVRGRTHSHGRSTSGRSERCHCLQHLRRWTPACCT